MATYGVLAERPYGIIRVDNQSSVQMDAKQLLHSEVIIARKTQGLNGAIETNTPEPLTGETKVSFQGKNPPKKKKQRWIAAFSGDYRQMFLLQHDRKMQAIT